MGIDIRVESENGVVKAQLDDPHDLTSQLLADYNDERSPCLRWVDPYGDTVFNQLQLPHLIAELEAARSSATDAQVRAHAEAALTLVRRAKQIHTYVRFFGD